MISRKKVVCPILLLKELPSIGYKKNQVFISKKKKNDTEICRKIFLNILHFLPLHSKMAVAKLILELDL